MGHTIDIRPWHELHVTANWPEQNLRDRRADVEVRPTEQLPERQVPMP
jgi:hypothetical protein